MLTHKSTLYLKKLNLLSIQEQLAEKGKQTREYLR